MLYPLFLVSTIHSESCDISRTLGIAFSPIYCFQLEKKMAYMS